MAMTHEVETCEQIQYAALEQVQTGMADPWDPRVAPFVGEVRHSLPPRKTSAGLLAPPDVQNPYLDKGDAPNVDGDYGHSFVHDDQYPQKELAWNTDDAQPIHPFEVDAAAWQLGASDLQSMFVDYYFNEFDQYLEAKEMSAFAALNGAEGQGYACQEHDVQVPFSSEFEAAVQYRNSWAQIFESTQSSEDWTPVQLQDVAYAYDVDWAGEEAEEMQPDEPKLVMAREPMYIELEPGAQPVYRRPYPVPRVHMATFKKELDHLVELGVLSPIRDTEWGLPTFIIPKKDGQVRWVSDMCELNKVIKRTQYTLPIISDVLRKQSGYKFVSKLDISMQYYTFELDEESKKLCTIVTPFGPYCYNRVPMGLKISPVYAQVRIEEILRGIEEIECYIDDIGVFTTTWEQHVVVLTEADLYDCLQHLPEMEDYLDVQDSFLNLPSSDDNPLSVLWLKDTQSEDTELLAQCEVEGSGFYKRKFDDMELVCFTEDNKNIETDWKICLTDERWITRSPGSINSSTTLVISGCCRACSATITLNCARRSKPITATSRSIRSNRRSPRRPWGCSQTSPETGGRSSISSRRRAWRGRRI
ncbi:hypothetical protein ACHAWF_014769 [Thalassiosira exigua]